MYSNIQHFSITFKGLSRNNLEAGKEPRDDVETPLLCAQGRVLVTCSHHKAPAPPPIPHPLSEALGDEGWKHFYYHLELVI